MRLFVSVLATAAIFLAASTAGAVNWVADVTTSLGSSLDALQVGETVTIDIRAEVGTTSSDMTAVGGSAYGYDSGVIAFTSGENGGGPGVQFFNTFLVPPTGPSFGGFTNATVGAAAEVGGRVNILQGVAQPPGLAAGASELNDIGLGGVLISAGGYHSQLIFTAAAAGSTVLTIGSDGIVDVIATDSGGAEAANNSVLNITVVPEPGTAILMGLGLVGLAAAGRRE